MKKTKTLFIWMALGIAATTACSPAAPGSGIELTGAGSTFVFPILSRWAADFKRAHPGVDINYQSIGSGAGIQQVKNHTVDFGASDAALTDQQLAQMPPLVQLPESAGPVCITYNLPIAQPLRLTPEALAGIYLGTITRWNDPRITSANAGTALPNLPVLVAHRSDGSGTTSIFTTYLSAVSADWKSKVGSGVAVNWPVGLGGKGSEGVTGVVKQSPGAIGYVELSYASANQLQVALMRNASGEYVTPSAAGASAAMSSFQAALARDVRAPIVNADSPTAYPIAGMTYLILPKDGSDRGKREALKQFVAYVVTRGQADAEGLGYAPLPASIQQVDEKLLGTLMAGGKTLR